MLDIRFIRENPDLVKEAVRKKRIDFNVDELVAVDDKRRALLAEVETLRATQNEATNKMGRTQDAGERQRIIADMRPIKESLQKKEDELKEVVTAWRALMVQVPNIPDMSVPEGASDKDNVEVRAWGEKKAFSFTPRHHADIMRDLDMADLERGAKVAGFRGYFLKNDGALLSFALWQYFLNTLVGKGFEPMIVPSMVRKEQLLGTGYIPGGEEDLYRTQDEDYLAGTAEVATMGYYMGEVIPKAELPKKFVSFSPCFRREAGSHGKDTRGLIRVHEFYKLEQVVLCEASHEESVRLHEELTHNVEEALQGLGIAYRVVLNCGGDLGQGQVKKYDIEAWVPSEGTYRETHSSSYFHDFQTRRLSIQYKDAEGKTRFVHSLNNTAVATPRLLVAIIEQYQQEDGSVLVPEVLRPYMNKEVIQKRGA